MAELTLPSPSMAPTPEAPKTVAPKKVSTRTDHFNAREELIVNLVIYGLAVGLIVVSSIL